MCSADTLPCPAQERADAGRPNPIFDEDLDAELSSVAQSKEEYLSSEDEQPRQPASKPSSCMCC